MGDNKTYIFFNFFVKLVLILDSKRIIQNQSKIMYVPNIGLKNASDKTQWMVFSVPPQTLSNVNINYGA
jgi:hypothetical protein